MCLVNRQTGQVLYPGNLGANLPAGGRDTLGPVPDDQQLVRRPRAPTTAERERTIALLSDRFAQGDLDMDVFEERITIAHRAQSAEELAALTADLALSATEAAGPQALEVATDAPASGEVTAIFGGVQRVGRWRMPRRLRAVAFFGGIELDLRDAELPAGLIELDVHTTFGGVQIIVPPGLAVEVQGTAIFGGFQHVHRAPPAPDPKAPLLHIMGRAIFGGVSVETRLPGESQRTAHRRRHQELRQQRHRRRLGP